MLNDKNVIYIKLKDVIVCERGKTVQNDAMDEGLIPIVASGEKPLGYTNKFNRRQPCITISSSGYAGGIILYWDKPIWASDCLTVVSKDNNILELKYLYYLLITLQPVLISLSTGGAVKHIYAKDLYNLEIAIPPIEIQNKIVSILNQFNNLTSNLQDGIPAEIKLRKEQYQDYLKQLLSFNITND